jgi:hypothetical protein
MGRPNRHWSNEAQPVYHNRVTWQWQLPYVKLFYAAQASRAHFKALATVKPITTSPQHPHEAQDYQHQTQHVMSEDRKDKAWSVDQVH